MKKIAFIIPRYGVEVNGGAEVHCRMLAERLCPDYQVEVLTTTVRDFGNPGRDYPQGQTTENGVTVRRFKPQPVDAEQHGLHLRQSKSARRMRLILRRLGVLGALSALHPVWRWGVEEETRALESDPSHAPALLHHIETHQAEYAALIFINLYFSQTALGAVIAPEKSVLIPLAHPNRRLYCSVNAPAFTRVRHIAFNTPAEERLCRRIYGRSLSAASIVGCGIDQTPAAEWDEVKARYGLPEQYALYLGRVSKGKVDRLLPYFERYKKRYGGRAKLVLAGGFESAFDRPASPDILFTGYVSDAEKTAIVRHAAVIINPSPLESLSLLMLEGMQNRIPLLVNGRSEVMKEHCKRSGAALWYGGGRDFASKLHRLFTDAELRRTMCEKGPAYVREHYDWEVVLSKLRTIIESI